MKQQELLEEVLNNATQQGRIAGRTEMAAFVASLLTMLSERYPDIRSEVISILDQVTGYISQGYISQG